MMTRSLTYLIIVILLLHNISTIKSLHLTHVQIPEYADIRNVATLSCSYMMGRHKLNSVKWYKDEREFFRYAPLMDQQISNWTVAGITLYSENPYSCSKTTCSVSLDNLSSVSSGVYRCEISADAPSFAINYTDQRMRIVALPRKDPIIHGLRSVYKVGDILEANCTSDASFPPAKLDWYLNNELVTEDTAQLTRFETIFGSASDLILRFRTLKIRLKLNENLNVGGQLFLKCIADIQSVPNTKRQTSDFVYIQSVEMSNLRLINSAEVDFKHTRRVIFLSLTSILLQIK